MDVFRFAKVPPRANDPTRHYRLLHAGARVGDVEITGDAPDGDAVALTMTCDPALSDAAREDALATARRFLEELVSGWGLAVLDGPADAAWEEQPDGRLRARLAFAVG
jgi:hypothetical protein